MKKMIQRSVLALALLAVTSGSALAIPTLQLDIAGGTYDLTTQTIMSPGTSFTLYAYLLPNSSNTLNDTYYISAAVVPKVADTANLGSFTFGGQLVNVTGDMTYGVPPLELNLTALFDSGDLPTHSIYSTYFREFGFQFTSAQQINYYNTQDRAKAGGAINLTGSGMYYVAFQVDTSNLDPNYQIHFDLYNTTLYTKRGVGDIDVTKFAPFSHDAQSQVPEPGMLLLLGTGLLGLGLLRRTKSHA